MPPARTTPLSLLPAHKTSLPRSVATHVPRRTLTHSRTSTRPTRIQHTSSSYLPPLHTCCKFFSTSTSIRKDQNQNYYEILDIPVTATPAEIKKKFYALSLRHHPDRNRADPTASQRFARISSAYSVLSNAQKRSTYDRDHGFHHAHVHPHHPTGSHSSHSNLHKGSHGGTGYAGSRPASGLSNRRGTFRGPPPSFYAQGGYGGTGRRGDGYAAGKAGPSTGETDTSAGGGGGFGSTGGAGAGTGTQSDPEDPMGFIHRNPLGHFNARGHFRTQKAEDARRRERISKARTAARERVDSFGGGDFGLVRFVVVCGILVTAGAMTGLFQIPVTSSEDGKGRK